MVTVLDEKKYMELQIEEIRKYQKARAEELGRELTREERNVIANEWISKNAFRWRKKFGINFYDKNKKLKN